MKIDRYRCQRAFEKYYKNYDVNDEKIALKIYHSKKVSELCDLISRALRLEEDDIDLAWLIGLVHDIGRFEQLKIYNTFQDSISIDHAMLGSKILFEKNEIRNYIDTLSEDMLIKKAVEQHSAYEVSGVIDERTLMFCDILRDADKIDILRVAAETPAEVLYKSYQNDDKISDKVLEDLSSKRTVLNEHKVTALDYSIGRISLIFGLKYTESLKIVKKQGYIEKLFESENYNLEANGVVSQLRKQVFAHIEKQ